MRRDDVKVGEPLFAVEGSDVAIDDVEVAVAKERISGDVLLVNVPERRLDVANLVGRDRKRLLAEHARTPCRPRS
jgi:hypothetical protein